MISCAHDRRTLVGTRPSTSALTVVARRSGVGTMISSRGFTSRPVPPVAARPDLLEEGQPLVLAAHPVQPVAAVGDRKLAHGRPDARVTSCQHDRIAAAGAAAAEHADRVADDVRPGLQVRDGAHQVLKLTTGREDRTVSLRVAEAPVVAYQD